MDYSLEYFNTNICIPNKNVLENTITNVLFGLRAESPALQKNNHE